MILFPAIDLRGGRAVRLRQGDPDRQTVFSDDPAQVAREFETRGAEWLHVVNLDGALGEGGAHNRQALAAIRRGVALPIQFGGGLRTEEDIQAALDEGIARVILGTVALEQPERVGDWVTQFGAERLVIALDTRAGRVATRGWREQTSQSAVEFARQLKALGVRRVLYTDIARDGMLTGVDVDGCVALARGAGLRVIASGGARGLADIRALKLHAAAGIEGLIVGQALYSGALDLSEALAAARQNNQSDGTGARAPGSA